MLGVGWGARLGGEGKGVGSNWGVSMREREDKRK